MDWDNVKWDGVAIGTKRRDNRYPGCTCPSWRYCPWMKRPTDPHCPEHGDKTIELAR
jgi:hypothetical protein